MFACLQPGGRIALPVGGQPDRGGQGSPGCQSQIQALYKPRLRKNEISVASESALTVYVVGAVNRSGKIVLDRPLSVLEAGGFARGLADPRHVRIIREVNGKHETREIDLTPALRGEVTTIERVQRNDVIYVPETWL